jgi:hypothetical protein
VQANGITQVVLNAFLALVFLPVAERLYGKGLWLVCLGSGVVSQIVNYMFVPWQRRRVVVGHLRGNGGDACIRAPPRDWPTGRLRFAAAIRQAICGHLGGVHRRSRGARNLP